MPRVIHFEMYVDDPERIRKFYQEASAKTRDRHERGWNGSLDKLEK